MMVGRRFFNSITFFSVIFILWLFLNAAEGEPKYYSGNTISSFCFAIGEKALSSSKNRDVLSRCSLLVVDGETVSSRVLQQLKAKDAIVLAYISVGTIEPFRSWYPKLKRYRLDRWSDWDEYYANVNSIGFQRTLLSIIKKILLKRFDGLFLDNVDMVVTHPGQLKGMKKLVSRISSYVRSKENLLFAQNGDEIIDGFVPMLDGWNREDVSYTYSFEQKKYLPVAAEERDNALRTIKRLKNRGLIVTTTDYLPKNAINEQELAISTSCSAGALPYISDIKLNRVPNEPIVCG